MRRLSMPDRSRETKVSGTSPREFGGALNDIEIGPRWCFHHLDHLHAARCDVFHRAARMHDGQPLPRLRNHLPIQEPLAFPVAA